MRSCPDTSPTETEHLARELCMEERLLPLARLRGASKEESGETSPLRPEPLLLAGAMEARGRGGEEEEGR